MEPNNTEIAQLVRSGEYYKQARGWYETIYIGPVSERAFFLVIAVLCGLIGLFGFIGLKGFLPVTEIEPVMVRAERIDETRPRLSLIGTRHGSINPAIMRFFIRAYVEKRESYSRTEFDADYLFVKAQSDAPTFAAYDARYNKSNPQSPAARLGWAGVRHVTVQSIRVDEGADPKRATVKFSTTVDGVGAPTYANWTAVLQFYYTDLVVTTETDPETGDDVLQTQDPQFQVVNYELQQAP